MPSEHEEGQHALLSPSSAERWLSCPASIRMSREVPTPPSSVYADEGTACHALAEIEARHALLLPEQGPDAYQADLASWRQEWTAYADSESDMRTHALAYVALLRDLLAEENGSQLLLEQRLQTGVPSSWGTSDAVIVSSTRVIVVDLKYGVGIQVYAAGNPQLRLYAIGALETFGDMLGVVDKVRYVVFQPRIAHVDSEEITATELRAWRDSLIPVAEQALGPDAPFGPSEEACRWCPASGQCKAQLEYFVREAFGDGFTDEDTETDQDYYRRHRMVYRARGSAADLACIDCAGKARDWSHVHDTSGLDPADYEPRCRSCHMKYDGTQAEAQRAKWSAIRAEREHLRREAWEAGERDPDTDCEMCARSFKNAHGLWVHLARVPHKAPDIMTDDELSEVLGRLDGIEAWCQAVRVYALDRAYGGDEIPGWKVVLGNGRRSVSDPAAVIESLDMLGFAREAYCDIKIKGIGELTKLGVIDTIAPFITKSEGKPALVPDTDPRPAVRNDPAADFHEETT